MYYKVSPSAGVVTGRGTIPSAHIAITSALLFSETVAPLMCSVLRLLWPQHVNAHTLSVTLHHNAVYLKPEPQAMAQTGGQVAETTQAFTQIYI